MRQSSSTRAHSTDQGKGTDADVGDGEVWSGDSACVEREHRGKAADVAGFDGDPARLRENRGWLTLSGQPSAHQPSGDGWVEFAAVENKSTGNAHTGTDRSGWSWSVAMERSEVQGDTEAWLFWPRRLPFVRVQEPVGSESTWGSRRASSSTSSMKETPVIK